ncbi:MAG TPA: TonB-dependent receptor [Candidatus Binatia bacterium]
MRKTVHNGRGTGRSVGRLAGRLVRVIGILTALQAAGAFAAELPSKSSATADLSRLTIDELANIEISSVSKRPEPLSSAPASIYVITREEIRRYGATSIPEILRLAPNLQVARVDASQYAITARGFNSTTANKLQVLIDGRSVYTPLFSGVFWDVQDTLIADIERIEVISGPGGTLWGSNAVNGVINIITRNSRDTTGGLASIGGGPDDRGASVRYGASIGEDTTYRVYAKGFGRENTERSSGASARDSWGKGQLGFRMDWAKAGDTLMLDGAGYDGFIDQRSFNDKSISGAHLLGRWNRTLQNQSAIQVQTYYDLTRRVYPGTFGEVLQTFDIDAQHRFSLGPRQEFVWGGGYRFSHDHVDNEPVLAFLPARRNLHLANVFVQDTIGLAERLDLTVGVKLEYNSYTRFEVQPNARLAWDLRDYGLLWSAISRAVRTPSRLDRELFAPGSPPFLLAGGDFKSETLIAYEIGYRVQPTARSLFSVSTFYNVYDDLRSIEPTSGGLPLVIDNKMEGSTYGVEMWGSYRLLDWWRLSAGYNYLNKNLRLKRSSGDTTGVRGAGNDPEHQFSARSTMNLPYNLELDLAARWIDRLPNPNVPSYVALDARLGWHVSKNAELSLAGFNLTDRRHPEFGTAATRSELGRTFYLRLRWGF